MTYLILVESKFLVLLAQVKFDKFLKQQQMRLKLSNHGSFGLLYCSSPFSRCGTFTFDMSEPNKQHSEILVNKFDISFTMFICFISAFIHLFFIMSIVAHFIISIMTRNLSLYSAALSDFRFYCHFMSDLANKIESPSNLETISAVLGCLS